MKETTIDSVLILIGQSKELFSYFNEYRLFGLQLSDCLEYNEIQGDVFIAGLCNSFCGTNFIFLNEMRLKDPIESALLVMHECMHLSFLLGIEDEEEIISFAEKISKKILSFLGF